MNNSKLAVSISRALAVTLVGLGSTAAFAAGPIHAPNQKPGNAVAECAQVAALIGEDFSFQYALKIDPPVDGNYEAAFDDDGDGVVDHFNAITIGGLEASGGQRFNFSATQPIGAVVVKGGNNGANYYLFDPQASTGENLKAPLNNNRNRTQANVSHMTFCWNPQASDECGEWDDETAWSAGARYQDKGNWGTYTAFSGETISVKLFAGQHLDAGDVSFSTTSGGEVQITVSLNEGWRFAQVLRNLKIQHYSAPPSGNPAPGGFDSSANASGSSFSMIVPFASYYGVHVDVERWIPAESCDLE